MTNWRSDLDVFIEETKAFAERAGAKRRLAGEYDAAQERGEIRGRGGDRISKLPDGKFAPSDIGLAEKQIHEVRTIRDAEVVEPGIVRRALDEKLALGEEPTKASRGPVAGLVGIEGGVVSEVINLESSGVGAPDRRPRHDQQYHEDAFPAV